MSIEIMPAVLSWTDGEAVVQRVHDRFESHAMSALWETVERIRCWDRQLAARLDRGMAEAGRDELQRLLLAPGTTDRLLRRGPHANGTDDAEVGRFLHRCLLAEAARAGRPAQPDDIVWTALGDGRLLPSGEFLPGLSIPAFVPLDFDGPPAGPAVLDEDSRRVAIERLTAARDLVRRTSSAVDIFVSRFTKVVVVRRDEQTLFSGCDGRSIGRSVAGRPHAPGVDGIHLAEVLVHQAVDSCLCVQEVLEPGVLGLAPYEAAPWVRSPWTGRSLPVRSFLRECFVRYGLLNFWCLVLGAGAPDPERIRERVREVLRGFVAAPVLGTASAHAAGMSDEVQAAIGQMQDVVGGCFDAVVV
jgi:hypothetical protein